MPLVILAASIAHAQCSTGTTALATKVCTPTSSSTVTSPLKFSAASSGARYSQLYIDGSKHGDYSVADVETSLSLSTGSHRLVFQAFNSAGSKSSVTEYVTVKTTTSSGSPTGTAVTACHQSLSANHSYYLASDLGGSDASAQCLTLTGPNMVLNLNGHKITGTLKVAGSMNISGVHVYNGTIHCADADSTHPGCLYINVDTDSPAITVPLEIDHISWTNTSNNSTNSERNIMVDFGGMQKTATGGANVKIHDNTSVSAIGLSNPRIANIWVQGTAHSNIGYAEFYNNATLCQSTAAACQGIVAYGLYNTKIHNNTLVNQMNQSNGDPARGALCDQTDACEIYSNTFDAQDGRAVRLRGTNNKNGPNSVHDNIVKNINQPGGFSSNIATFHLGDPDSGTEVENATVRNNTITNYIKGWVFMARGTSNITIQDNSVSAASGTSSIDMLDARSDGGIGPATNINLFRTTVSGSNATSNCQSGTSANVCKSGVVTGAGNCKITTGC
jgi:hypothetical protein